MTSRACAGFIDVSLTLYDLTTCQFQVAAGPGSTVPSSDYLRLPYVANVAVDQRFRRFQPLRQFRSSSGDRLQKAEGPGRP